MLLAERREPQEGGNEPTPAAKRVKTKEADAAFGRESDGECDGKSRIVARLDRLEAENERLKAEVARLNVKVNALEALVTSDESAPLPAAVWARILSDYLPYDDARRCAAASRSFLFDVAPLVSSLFVFRPRDLSLPAPTSAAAVFPAARRVFLCCLTSLSEEGSDGFGGPKHVTSISAEAADRAVPFLTGFSRLEFVHFGGYTPSVPRFVELLPDGAHCDLAYRHDDDDTGRASFRRLVHSLSAAFQAGDLPSDLVIAGVVDLCPTSFLRPVIKLRPGQMECQYGHSCRGTCVAFCRSFPIVQVAFAPSGELCVDDRDRYSMVFNRDPRFLMTSDILNCFLRKCSVSYNAEIAERIRSRTGERVGFAMAASLEEKSLRALEYLCRTCKCDPSRIPRHEVVSELTWWCQNNIFGPTPVPPPSERYLLRETFDALVSLGFNIRKDDFCVV